MLILFKGKSVYQSPEISDKKPSFDAKKNDIWCLGVCLFMMTVGVPPWTKSNKKYESFNYIMNGYIIELLNGWDKLKYVNSYLITLFQSIFKYEDNRCDIQTIKTNRWCKQ